MRLLLTLPGVDLAVAQTLLAALGDVGRFRTPDHAASYLGLVPSTRQSAECCKIEPVFGQAPKEEALACPTRGSEANSWP